MEKRKKNRLKGIGKRIEGKKKKRNRKRKVSKCNRRCEREKKQM